MRKINFKKIGLAVALLMSAFTFQSCDTDDDTNWDQVLPNALVTVKQNADACYLQLDDNTTLLAKNLKTPVFDGKEVRALVNYTATDEKSDKYSQVVHVNWIDSILTKKPAPYLSTPAVNRLKKEMFLRKATTFPRNISFSIRMGCRPIPYTWHRCAPSSGGVRSVLSYIYLLGVGSIASYLCSHRSSEDLNWQG